MRAQRECVPRWRRWPASRRPTSSAGRSRRLQRKLPNLKDALALGDAVEDAQRRALGVTAATDEEVIALAVNWQAEPRLREAARIVQRLGAKRCAERAGRILGWLGLEADERREHWPQWCEEFLTKEGKPRASSQFVSKAVTDAHPDIARHFLDECDRISRGDRYLRGIARRRGFGRTADARRAGAARLCGAQGCIRSAGLRRPDRPHVQSAGRSRRRLGAVQAGWRPRSPAAGRGAGHRAGAVAHRACADRGILRRRGGAGRASHRVRRRRSQAVDLFVPGCRCRCVRPIAPTAARTGGGGQPALAGRAARRVVPLHTAGAGAGRSGVRQPGRRRGRGRSWADTRSPRRSRGTRRRCRAMAARATARCGGTAALDGAGSESWPDLGAAASGGDAGAVDCTRGRWRHKAGKQGPVARSGRRDGPGAAAQRFRPGPGALP